MRAVISNALLALVLLGCATEKEDDVAGVDDFPNSVYARMQGNLNDAGEGSQAPVPTGALSVLQGAPAAPQVGGLPKQGLAPGLLKASFESIPDHLLERFATDSTWIFFTVTQSDPEKTSYDTLFFKPGTQILDSVSRILGLVATKRTEVYKNGKVTLSMFRDGDGDGAIVTPLLGAKVSVLFVNQLNDTSESAVLMTDGGPDGNTATEPDNRIYQAEWLRLSGEDTVSRAAYADADSDGVVIDNGAPSLVDLVFFERDPKDKPEAAERSLNLRVIARYKQEPQEIRRFAAVERLRNGSRHAISMRNVEGGEDLDLQGKTTVRMSIQETPESDSLESLEVESVIKPESAIGADRDSLFSYSAKAIKRLGEEREAYFAFTVGELGKPIAPKTQPRNGRVTFRIDYRDSTWVLADGELKEGALSASITARDGTLYVVDWDANGNMVRAQVTKP
jgi:hypothetical protein